MFLFSLYSRSLFLQLYNTKILCFSLFSLAYFFQVPMREVWKHDAMRFKHWPKTALSVFTWLVMLHLDQINQIMCDSEPNQLNNKTIYHFVSRAQHDCASICDTALNHWWKIIFHTGSMVQPHLLLWEFWSFTLTWTCLRHSLKPWANMVTTSLWSSSSCCTSLQKRASTSWSLIWGQMGRN